MTQYSIGGIDITLQELCPEGGHSWGGERLYGMHNCEWAAQIVVRSGYRGPLVPIDELLPRFCAGNRDKFDGDLQRIGPLLRAAIAAPGATMILREPEAG
jgi:hypothetical protein